jgi:lipopolysaccharide transport system ATP-binding protein
MWALRDVTFDISRGDVVGIIGRNGAGKSTLLKVLSRITEPTEGVADIYGRVGSLLEVGTGFHNELSGRENIFLNGAIIGMHRHEINARFDEIVAFAEVERFVDTPVKHYSTGMYLRLAFAVAAHLEPEILLVDEVLAVGDAAFQAKCLGKMDDVAKQGRTVLFVSHNMSAMRTLCRSAVLLDHGVVRGIGEVAAMVEEYHRLVGSLKSQETSTENLRSGFGPVTITPAAASIEHGSAFSAETTLVVPEGASGFMLFCTLADMNGRQVFQVMELVNDVKPGIYAARVEIPPLWLKTGIYSLHFKAMFMSTSQHSRYLSDHVPVDIVGGNPKTGGFMDPKVAWTIAKHNA